MSVVLVVDEHGASFDVVVSRYMRRFLTNTLISACLVVPPDSDMLLTLLA